MTRETLKTYGPQGNTRSNVTKITSDNGSVSYLTQSTSFPEETNRIGACKLNTIENEKKHVLFFFNSADVEVGRYYLGQNLQGQTPAQLAEKKHFLCFFESWNPNIKDKEGNIVGGWVPCVGLSKQEDLSKSAVSF